MEVSKRTKKKKMNKKKNKKTAPATRKQHSTPIFPCIIELLVGTNRVTFSRSSYRLENINSLLHIRGVLGGQKTVKLNGNKSEATMEYKREKRKIEESGREMRRRRDNEN